VDPTSADPPPRSLKDRSYVLLLNVRADHEQGHSNYRDLMPTNARVLQSNEFRLSAVQDAKRKLAHVDGIPAERVGQNCNDVCAGKNLICKASLFAYINSCEALNTRFKCNGCESSLGNEQPVYVSPMASRDHLPGKCLITMKPEETTCDSSHPDTYRLCPCA
jgi:hypothetical protein